MCSIFIASTLLIVLQILHCVNARFLDLMAGDIYAGNFTYFNLVHPGLVSLELISDFGDCDIYVSQYEKNPTFDPRSYCLQSSSCGVDVIIVPKSFKRPLAIGIYGHPSHEISRFTLFIYQIDNLSDGDEELDELYITTKYGSQLGTTGSVEKDNSAYQSLPFIMIFIYYLYNVFHYLFDLSGFAQFASNDLIEVFLEFLFF